MRTVHGLWIALLLLLATLTRSEAQSNIEPNKWESSFTANTLTSDDLNAFETRGMQKVRDFYNYLGFVCSPNYDARLRETGKKQATELFYDSNSTISGTRLMKFMDSCSGKVLRNSFQVSEVSMKDKLVVDKENPQQYDGVVVCKVEDGWGHNHDKTVTLILCKRDKKFGADTKQVWTIFIGDIK
jgi:hypothetical protein